MNKPVLVGVVLVVAVGVALGSAITARIAAVRADGLRAEIERHTLTIAALEKHVSTLEIQLADARSRAIRAQTLAETLQSKAEAAEKSKDPFAASRKAEADRAYDQLKRDVAELKQQLKK